MAATNLPKFSCPDRALPYPCYRPLSLIHAEITTALTPLIPLVIAPFHSLLCQLLYSFACT
jgi:hypothetical protein